MGPTYIVKNRITPSSVISIAIVAIFLMYISPKISSAFANVNQPNFSAAPNQILTKNNSGIIILENATVIDGTDVNLTSKYVIPGQFNMHAGVQFNKLVLYGI